MTTTGQEPTTAETTPDGRKVYTITGDVFDTASWTDRLEEEGRLVVNVGPQHPSSHGVCRMVVELDGETVTQMRPVVGYLHTGIEKNMEYRTWTQGTTFATRADYVSPISNETAYCLAVERLLGVEAPARAQTIRILMLELNRIASHLILLASSGMELGASTMMVLGLREREMILEIFELVTGLRMNMAYVRPGGVAQDLMPEAVEAIETFLRVFPGRLRDYERLMNGQPVFQRRAKGVGHLDLSGCMALGITGPVLRSAGLGWDLRRTMPYLGYETYDFEVPTETSADVWGRWVVRIAECRESLRIIRQALDRLEPGPVMVEDRKIAWPAQLAIGTDGVGNSLAHVKKIMGQSMESLIHHFKLVTEGFRVPAGQVYVAIESPRGELGCHAVSDGGTRPFRVHLREPSFVNLQALPAVCEGALLADVVAAGASLDAVMGGCDR